ncbi:MAG: AsmA family protein [Rhizobiaceae bacterium]|nr:AsmA family protein [Rhizobiaceae bacterium]
MLARLFVLIGGLFVLALTAALVAPYFIDWTNYRADFEREASNILGRPVTVRGDASARLLPFPSVTFSDVVVGATATRPAMTVEAFSMDAELAPFMSGEFRIFDLRLVRPKATVEIGEDGVVDWAVRPSAPISAARISLEKLTISEGEITVVHRVSGREHHLTNISLEASARSLLGPWRIDGSLDADGRQAEVNISTSAPGDDGAMRVKIRTSPALYPLVVETDGDITIKEGAPTYAGAFKVFAKDETSGESAAGEGGAALKGDRVSMPPNRLSGKFTFDDRKLLVEEFRFESGPLGDPYVADGTAFVDIGPDPRFSIVADGAQVRLGDAIAGQDGVAGQSLDRRLSDLRNMLEDLPRPGIPGAVEVKLPAIVAGDTMIREVSVSAEPKDGGWAIKSLAAVLPGRSTVEANGFLSTDKELGFKGQLLLAVAQPSGFMAWISKDVDEAIRRLPAAGFSADVDLTPERQHFANLEMQLGKANFRGEVDSRLPADARPTIAVRLQGGAVDFDGLSAFTSLFVSEEGTRRFGDADLDIDLKAGPVAVAGISADTLDTALRLRRGTLEIDRLSIGGLVGSTISATGSVKGFPAHPTGTLDTSLVGVDLQPLLGVLVERLPDQPVLTWLRDRGASFPGLFADSEINLVLSASTDGDTQTNYAVNAKGVSGGSEFEATYAGQKGDGEKDIKLSFKAKNSDATSLLALTGITALPIGLTGAGETEISAEGSWPGGVDTRFSFSGDGTEARFDGTLSSAEKGLAAKGSVSLTSIDIEPWMMTAGLGLPGMGTGTSVDLKADADYASGLLVLSGLQGVVADGAVAGDINLEVKEGVPHLAGQLSLDELDLQPLARITLGEGTLESSGNSEWASTPFRQASVTPFGADLDLTAASLSAGPIATLADAHATLRLDSEGMRISDVTGGLAEGTVGGLLELKNTAGTGLFTAQLKLTNANIDRLVPGIGLEGRADLSTTLSASGKTLEGVVAALSGSGTASVRDLIVKGVNPSAFAPIIAEADRVGQDIDAAKTAAFASPLVKGGQFAAGDADIAYTVAAGVVRAPPLTLKNEAATITADIRVDLNTGTLGADGSVTYVAGDEALVGSEPTVTFAASGAPGAMSASFDTAALSQFLTQRALEKEQARVEAMQAELLEKQRLRREAKYYAALEEERARVEAERQKADEERRLQAEEAARLKAEEEAKAQAQAVEEAKRAQEAREAEARRAADEVAKRAAAEKARRAADEQSKRDAEAAERAAEEVNPTPAQQTIVPAPLNRDSFDTSPPETRRPLLDFRRLFGN